jgi:pyruvate formate lyase activating enzyme
LNLTRLTRLGFIYPREAAEMACAVCGEEKTVSRVLGVCLDCIRDRPEESLSNIKEAHRVVRARYGLPAEPPHSPDGIECGLCSNDCSIGVGEHGFCGLRWNDGRLQSFTSPDEGRLYAYLDPHATNCCSAWFCPGGTGAGYPRYARRPGVERGYANLSVFLYGCNFDCLFCQNASHKQLASATEMTAEELASQVTHDEKITCICYFGGSPEPQLPFTLKASRLAVEAAGDRALRLCWEWNGCGDPGLVREAARLAFISGGNVKFDLKCHTPSLSQALSGVDNTRAYCNFETVARLYNGKRPEVPVLTATTLLVPGYVDAEEVDKIARFIASLDASIPYSLLLFHPAYAMSDLPVTPLSQAQACYRAASEHLDNVNVGNLHMLGMRSLREFLDKL